MVVPACCPPIFLLCFLPLRFGFGLLPIKIKKEPLAAEWLRGQGYEVFSAHQASRGAEDDVLLEKGFAEN